MCSLRRVYELLSVALAVSVSPRFDLEGITLVNVVFVDLNHESHEISWLVHVFLAITKVAWKK